VTTITILGAHPTGLVGGH